MKKTENYTIDFATETIIVSKKFLKEAGIFGSPAYNTLKDIRRDNPSFPIVVREIKKKENKKSYRNLTVDNMKTFIQNCMEDAVRCTISFSWKSVFVLAKSRSSLIFVPSFICLRIFTKPM